MPPQTPAPQDPQSPKNTGTPPAAPPVPPPQSASAHVDIGKMLLPNKGAPSVDSAQRVNAGILFDQEQKASLPEPPKPEGVQAEAQEPKPERPLVQPLQTYQSDIESLVDKKNVSVVSIAAAEEDRRTAQLKSVGIDPEQGGIKRLLSIKTLLVFVGVIMLVLGLGVGTYIYLRLQPVPIAKQFPAPFILVDDTLTVVLAKSDGRGALMEKLTEARDAVDLSVGLVARIQVGKETALGGSLEEVSASEFLQTLSTRVPPELVRTLGSHMLLGVHSFDENQAFMILQPDSYETAYSGMLAWEATMQADLLPLFKREPPIHRQPAPALAPIATSSIASSTVASSTNASSSASSTAPAVSKVLQSSFADQVVANRDARVLLNADGESLLLWAFLDRNTILIATNASTLREVVSRLSQASVLSLPAAN
jgi:hypothetical protein